MLTSLIGAHSRVRIGVPSASRLAFAVADGRGAFRTLSAALVAATPSATTPTPGENDAVVAFPSTSYALRRWRVDHRTTAATACVSSLSGAAVAHSSPSSSCYHSSYHRRRHPPSRPSCATWSIVSGRSHHARAMPFSSFSSSTATDASVKNDERFRDGKPTLEYAMTLPKTFASMTNEQVLHFAELSIPEACRECVVRDIMSVDRVEYDEAMKVFERIRKTNREGMSLAAVPFYSGFGAAMIGCYASIPLVFDRPAVEWFNARFVTAELPPDQDLETVLEVGSAAWGWMEPVLGTVSFCLLCLQFARAQLQNLGIRPYFHWQQERRAARLVRVYPQYDSQFLANYSKCDSLANPHKLDE